jgi:hypothetical protein
MNADETELLLAVGRLVAAFDRTICSNARWTKLVAPRLTEEGTRPD